MEYKYKSFFDYYLIKEKYPEYMRGKGKERKSYRELYRIIYNFVTKKDPALDYCKKMIETYKKYDWYRQI